MNWKDFQWWDTRAYNDDDDDDDDIDNDDNKNDIKFKIQW